MKKFTYLLLLSCVFSSITFAANTTSDPIKKPNNTTEERYYPASLQEGLIGVSEQTPLDSPVDNIFTVQITETPAQGDQIWLQYELYGISDHTGISRSVNDQMSVGGFLVQTNNQWNTQQERLHSAWLKKGDNSIRFTIPENVGYHYKIRNLGIIIKKAANTKREIVLNTGGHQQYYEHKAYVKGFVTGKGSAHAKVFVDGIRVQSLSNEFEAMVFNQIGTAQWTSLVKVEFLDGTSLEKEIVFTQAQPLSFEHAMSSKSALFSIENYQPNSSLIVEVKGAEIAIQAGALNAKHTISITSLRQLDIPVLDGAMVNVTKNFHGFRFLPHGTQFKKEVQVSLGYDATKIPEGYTEKDIKTYYFDDISKHWVALKKDSLLVETHTIVSKTMHFTDMINGIIKVPESPETAGYTPTSMKDIKAANPSAAVNMIAPPSANNMGTANIGYPIALPAGRQGMQPQVGIQYSSGSGNGWLGLGWDLQIPSVSIDTRWGVPRYNSTMETETYSIGGGMLAPVAHRNALVARSSNKQFHPRVEGSFNKIIRQGDSPKNYWWQVTDKSGTVYSYGGTSALGIVNTSVLKDADGNIAHWALVEVRDLNSNFVRYHCTKVMDVGVQGGSVPGYNIYVEKITYTGHGTAEGKYEVLFTRDRELGETKRVDVSINARLGFKQVTADLLRKIEVKFNGQNIRHYELEYVEGAFYKTLLTKITEFDAAGQEFNHHDFEYFDDVKAAEGYQPYTAEENWTPQDDNVHGDFIVRVGDFNDNASALYGTKSAGFGFSVSLTAGPNDAKLISKKNTAGANFGYSETKGEGMLILLDINGDNLPDKVYTKDDGKIRFRINKSGPNNDFVFGDEQIVIGISSFSNTKTSVNTYGIESHFGVYVGAQFTDSKSITKSYFTEVNGDNLIDFVKNGKVYFNHLENGVPTFTLSSNPTPSPIDDSIVGIDPNLIEVDLEELEKNIDKYPLHDIVRFWEAPYDGIVNIEAPILLNSQSVDGVRVAIQHKDIELWSHIIAPNTSAEIIPSGVEMITVSKGNRIYFRAQSIENGEGDIVLWDPVISYQQHTQELVDANNIALFQFKASDGFIISENQTIGMPVNGSISIEGLIEKPVCSDDTTFIILKTDDNGISQIVWEQTYFSNQLVSENLNLNFNVASNDTFSFKIKSDSNIDWSATKWSPRVYYTASSDSNFTTVNNPDGSPVLEFFPVVDYGMYAKVLTSTSSWTPLLDETITILPQISLTDLTQNGTIIFTVKKENELVNKQELTVLNGVVSGISTISLNVLQNETYYFNVFTKDTTLTETIVSSVQIIDNTGSTTIDTGVATKNSSLIFGPMYQNWGHFGYNGNRERATQPIHESELNLSSLESADSIDIGDATTAEEMEASYESQGGQSISDQKFIILLPDNKLNIWKGYDDKHWLAKNEQSTSRFGMDDITSTSPSTVNGIGARGIDKINKSFDIGISGSAGIGVSTAVGSTWSVTEFQDFNGDRYPDIVSENKIQYTKSNGTLEETATNVGTSYFRKSSHSATGISLNGSPVNSKSQISGTMTSFNEETGMHELFITEGKKIKDGKYSFNISGGISLNEESSKHTFIDVNGDGLPDKVYSDGQVALNFGYSFAPKETWSFTTIRDGNGEDLSAGLGFSIDNNSIAGGVGLSLSLAHAKNAVQDINGDGLPDYFDKDAGIILLNTGSGFKIIPWSGIDNIQENVSVGESANIAYTICFPLFGVKVCVNPSVSLNHGASKQKVQISDINGDGFPDILTSNKDNQLKVKRSTIARTNLLKGVQRPLGASFVIDYRRLGNTYDQPNDIWTLASVQMQDGFEGDGADTMASSFEYENGQYNRHERAFYGFKTVKSHQLDTENDNAIYRSVVQEFKNDNYYENGVLEREVLQDADENIYTESLNTFALKDINSGATLPVSFKTSDDGTAFVASIASEKKFYEGETSAQKSIRMIYNYDLLGNVTGYTDFGDAGSEDDISSTIAYHSVPSTYIMGTPSRITVSGNGQQLRKRETDIDTSTGSITQIRKFLQDGGAATYDMSYNAFGNLTKMTRPENAAGQRLFFDYEYDNQVNTYTTKVSDGYGYSSTSEYDFRFGQMLLSTDLNGHQMRYEIDDLGRITTITGPFELEAGLPYTIAFDYHPEAEIPWASTQHYDPAHPTNNLETVTFIDGLSRSIQVKKDGAIHNAANVADTEQMIVSGRILFDAFGRAVSSYYPRLEPKGSEAIFNPSFDNITPTKTTYDVLDRGLTVTLPDNAITETRYGFGADRDGNTQFSTQVIDANGIWKESYTNVRGLTKAVQEQYSQGTDIWTSYQYNAINELVTVKDDQDNIINSTYDWFGRRTEVLHPDAGTTTYAYDLASNLTQKVTANLAANNTAISYVYDQERLTNINYPENTQNNVSYTYGDAGAAENRAGRIVLQEDTTGAQEFFYNQLGAVTKNVRTILIPDSEPLSYTSQWQYDTWNRVTIMTYPDQEIVTYNYNLGGLLHSMEGAKDGTDYNYVKQLGYDKFEQRVYLGYGNQTETFYTYEADRRRLKTMISETAADRKMMDNVYTYDKVNNILRLQNNAEIPSSNLMGGKTDYNYTYDDLYRLTDATGSHLGSDHENKYSLAMEYNSIHSIVKKDQLHQFKGYDDTDWAPRNKTTYTYDYEYGDAQPHAPIHIGENAYSYDANGNQIGVLHDTSNQTREILWDEENRIKAIADNGAVFNYVYDAGGERVLKSNGGGQKVAINGKKAGGSGSVGNYTIYVNPYLVIRNGKGTKHFYIESQRIVTKLLESSEGLLQEQAGASAPLSNPIDYNQKHSKLQTSINKIYADFGIARVAGEAGNSGKIPPGQSGIHPDHPNNGNNGGGGDGDGEGSGGNGTGVEKFIFYYHPDHLGSSSYITDANGEVTQHVEYFAFGETFLEEHSNTDNTPYLFNGKELDEETGLYYYGARYYDAKTSVWVSVDPLAEETMSPYGYCYQNPINLVDPNGMAPLDWIIVDKNGYFTGGIIKDDKIHGIQRMDENGTYERFIFNDQKNDINFIQKYIDVQQLYYNDNSVEKIVNFVSGNYVSELQKEKMSGGEKIWGVRHIYAHQQSGGGRMDAIQFLFEDFVKGNLPDILRNTIDMGGYHGDAMFFIHRDSDNEKAYNFHDFGNYNWGGAMFELGFNKNGDLMYILGKAQGNENGNDTNADQKAISDGYLDSKKRNE